MALEKDPEFGEAYSVMGLILTDQDKHQEAVKYIEEALSIYPQNVVLFSKLAQSYKKLKIFDKAFDCW